MSSISAASASNYPVAQTTPQSASAPAPAPAPAADPDHDGDHDTPGAVDVKA